MRTAQRPYGVSGSKQAVPARQRIPITAILRYVIGGLVWGGIIVCALVLAARWQKERLDATSKPFPKCDDEVKRLADEIWGEIDHRINYPEAHPSLPCREQLRVLARVASSCSRLVDAIMVTHDERASRPVIAEATSVDNAAPPQTKVDD